MLFYGVRAVTMHNALKRSIMVMEEALFKYLYKINETLLTYFPPPMVKKRFQPFRWGIPCCHPQSRIHSVAFVFIKMCLSRLLLKVVLKQIKHCRECCGLNIWLCYTPNESLQCTVSSPKKKKFIVLFYGVRAINIEHTALKRSILMMEKAVFKYL